MLFSSTDVGWCRTLAWAKKHRTSVSVVDVAPKDLMRQTRQSLMPHRLSYSHPKENNTKEFETPVRTLHFNKIFFRNMELSIDSGLSLQVDFSFEDGFYIAFNERFGVYGSGKSEEEALLDFKESFIDFYDDIVNTPEEELGDSTLKLKTTLIKFATLTQNG